MRGGGMLGQDGHGMRRMVGAGTGGRRRKTSEAMEMGHALSKHIHELHGGGFWDDFKSGFNSVVAPVAGLAKPFLPMLGPEGAVASAGLSALGYGRRRGRGTGAGTGAGRHRMPDGSMMNDADMRGGGFLGDMLGMIPGVGQFAAPVAGMLGLGKKRRAPAGANDGRRKRAEVVKRVMADKGMSMIDASKYVKAHGLY